MSHAIPADNFLDIFQFLKRKEIEKCRLVNHKFLDIITQFDTRLPLCPIEVLENDENGNVKLTYLDEIGFLHTKIIDIQEGTLIHNLLKCTHIRKIHLLLAINNTFEIFQQVRNAYEDVLSTELCEIYCKTSETDDLEKILHSFSNLFNTPKAKFILRSWQLNFVLHQPDLLPKPPTVVDLIIRERKDSKQTWIEFRLLAKLISGQIGKVSLKNEIEIFLFDGYVPFIANIAKRFIASKNPEAAFKTVSIKLDHSFESFLHIRYLQPFMNQIEGVHLGIEHDLEKDRKEDYHVHHPFGQIMQISYIGLFESTEENFGCIVPGIVYWMKGDPIDMESDEEGGDSSKNAVVNREDEMDMLDVGVVDEATTSAVPSTSQQNEIKQQPKSRWERMKSFLKNKK